MKMSSSNNGGYIGDLDELVIGNLDRCDNADVLLKVHSCH